MHVHVHVHSTAISSVNARGALAQLPRLAPAPGRSVCVPRSEVDDPSVQPLAPRLPSRVWRDIRAARDSRAARAWLGTGQGYRASGPRLRLRAPAARVV